MKQFAWHEVFSNCIVVCFVLVHLRSFCLVDSRQYRGHSLRYLLVSMWLSSCPLFAWFSDMSESMDNSPPHANEYVTPPPRSTYPMLTSPAAPIAPRVFNMAQDENGENETEARVETSQFSANF